MPPMSFKGVVTKVGVMNKTATVTVARHMLHKRTGKEILRQKKFLTHDENNSLRLHDEVIIRNCRPLSAQKRFTLDTILRSSDPETQRRLEAQRAQAQQAQNATPTQAEEATV